MAGYVRYCCVEVTITTEWPRFYAIPQSLPENFEKIN
jgi:hypothetical protein